MYCIVGIVILYIRIMRTDHVFGCAWHPKGAGMHQLP